MKGLFFYFIFSKNFGLTDLIPPPYPNFCLEISYTGFGQLFQKIDSVLLQFWVKYGFWF